MPLVLLRTALSSGNANGTAPSPLPSLLQTPTGLAIVEIQGTIRGPFQSSGDNPHRSPELALIGRLDFPLYSPRDQDEGKWMKKVYLYVGKHQRLTGEIKKLAKPLAVLRKANENDSKLDNLKQGEDLEVVDIVKFKLLFSGRPEPVGE
ncbi:uncharacterized protein Z518_06171 [Rhinocladiella mackenziei CBS 650.93]|uniref:Chromosome transmission fidelity protein 8 n=1 Tax=Rhinocladiella mackenziei CBS 650.93 TaxID=1442369 RepID=A0A0D2IHN1_9EURO|nr:uncharacterized protein Z518_06171 [Rhinocladiella mackenziei CBS 650.93]KIX05299.1 hypothetical protein Z518_06171 [Rhinocladiella mackenziei CBS 650.93]